MTPDPKPGAPVRLTDEELDELGLHIGHPPGSRVHRLYVEARSAREEVETWKAKAEVYETVSRALQSERDALRSAYERLTGKLMDLYPADMNGDTGVVEGIRAAMDALRSQLEEARELVDTIKTPVPSILLERSNLRTQLHAARDRIETLEGALEAAHMALHEGEELHAEGCPTDDTCDCSLNVQICMALYGVEPGQNVPLRAALAPGSTPVACARCEKLEGALRQVVSELFIDCQPDRGDLFSKIDDLVRAALAPAPGTAPTRKETMVHPDHSLKREGGFVQCIKCGLAEWDLKHPCEPRAAPATRGVTLRRTPA